MRGGADEGLRTGLKTPRTALIFPCPQLPRALCVSLSETTPKTTTSQFAGAVTHRFCGECINGLRRPPNRFPGEKRLKWCARRDLNPRPTGSKPATHPAELRARTNRRVVATAHTVHRIRAGPQASISLAARDLRAETLCFLDPMFDPTPFLASKIGWKREALRLGRVRHSHKRLRQTIELSPVWPRQRQSLALSPRSMPRAS